MLAFFVDDNLNAVKGRSQVLGSSVDYRVNPTRLFASPHPEAAKAFIHLVVDEIHIYAEEVTVSGQNLGLME